MDNNLFKVFCIKELDFFMKIMASWMTLYKLEGEMTRRYLIDSSRAKEMKQFT